MLHWCDNNVPSGCWIWQWKKKRYRRMILVDDILIVDYKRSIEVLVDLESPRVFGNTRPWVRDMFVFKWLRCQLLLNRYTGSYLHMYSGPCVTRQCNSACGKMHQRGNRSACSETRSRNSAGLPERSHSSAKYFRYRYRSETRAASIIFATISP